MTFRRTKIVATLGPATSSEASLESIILAGVDMVRLNFSHGSHEAHAENVNLVRRICEKHGCFVSIMGDLQGPKLRIARFVNDRIKLQRGDAFIIDADLDAEAGNQERVGIDYKELIDDVVVGDVLLLDDGRIELEVNEVCGKEIRCTTLVGGFLSNNKGINRRGGGLSAAALTEKDIKDIAFAATVEIDYLAVSFPRDASDMEEARGYLREAGSEAGLIAKIERAEIIQDDTILDNIIHVSDGIMIARGDLAVEIGDAGLVGVQKRIIRRVRTLNKFVITATQMMESMVDSPVPTRAEVSDVANAVYDCTDAVMLSAESAVGEYPAEAVKAMDRICLGAEGDPDTQRSGHRIYEPFHQVDEAIGLAAMYAANHLVGVKALVCLTETGANPLLMSRIRSGLPIFALSGRPETQRRVTIYRSVKTIPFDTTTMPVETVNRRVVELLLESGYVEKGDLIIMTKGDYMNAQGGTNTVKILRAGDDIC
ncbi:MAG: pyruvate kinase [Gammaproteobacteria bacterium]